MLGKPKQSMLEVQKLTAWLPIANSESAVLFLHCESVDCTTHLEASELLLRASPPGSADCECKSRMMHPHFEF
jgi:hypothetical protein